MTKIIISFLKCILSIIKIFLLLFNYSCLRFPPINLPLPYTTPNSHIQSSPSPCLCPWVVYKFLDLIIPLLSPVILFPPPLWLLSILYVHVFVSVLLTCLFCWLGSTYRWDHMIFVFTTWLISHSIILSSSIHAVAKGRSSFLSAFHCVKCTTVFWSIHLLVGP